MLCAASADALACRLAPQRPLKTIAKVVNDVFIPRGINVPALDRKRKWDFTPVAGLKLGDHVTGGDVFGVRALAPGAGCGAQRGTGARQGSWATGAASARARFLPTDPNSAFALARLCPRRP